MKTILFLGSDVGLFTSCFGNEEQWTKLGCQFKSLPEGCDPVTVGEAFDDKDLQCVVVQDTDDEVVWNFARGHYESGGFVVFFGIYGEFTAPADIGGEIGVKWQFSGYTNHAYVLTPVAFHYVGDAIRKQQYTKSNLVSAPEGDRLMVPDVMTMEEYLQDTVDDEDDKEEVARAKKKYPDYVEAEMNQSPLVMHRNAKGGRFAYLGFVNGDGMIPKIVQALLTDTNTST